MVVLGVDIVNVESLIEQFLHRFVRGVVGLSGERGELVEHATEGNMREGEQATVFLQESKEMSPKILLAFSSGMSGKDAPGQEASWRV